jgi:putative transposase
LIFAFELVRDLIFDPDPLIDFPKPFHVTDKPSSVSQKCLSLEAFRGQECPRYTTMGSFLDRHYSYRRRLPHYQKQGVAVFVTFRKLLMGDFTNRSRTAILEHCLHDNGSRYKLHAAVIMPDHVHLLLTPLADEAGWPFSLATILRCLKGTSAHSVNGIMATKGPVWQEESFDHVLRSDESMAQKLEYIRQNPVRQGLASDPENYPWLWLCSADTPVRGL